MPEPEPVAIEGPVYGAGPNSERVLRDLPEWFGIEEATVDYIAQADKLPTFIARMGKDTVGFMSLKIHFPESAELYVLGVMKDFHRRGIGKRLLAASEAYLKERGVRFVQVKTLSARADDAGYEKTRKFYESAGYVALEEFPELWDPHNPALQLIKYL